MRSAAAQYAAENSRWCYCCSLFLSVHSEGVRGVRGGHGAHHHQAKDESASPAARACGTGTCTRDTPPSAALPTGAKPPMFSAAAAAAAAFAAAIAPGAIALSASLKTWCAMSVKKVVRGSVPQRAPTRAPHLTRPACVPNFPPLRFRFQIWISPLRLGLRPVSGQPVSRCLGPCGDRRATGSASTCCWVMESLLRLARSRSTAIPSTRNHSRRT